MLKQYKLKDYRFRLVAFVVALTVIGILIVGSTQESLQSRQAMGMFAGLFVMVVASLIDYNLLLKFRRIFLSDDCGFAGTGFGSRRWKHRRRRYPLDPDRRGGAVSSFSLPNCARSC